MILYYPGPHLRITDKEVEVARPTYRRFAIDQLDRVHIARADNRGRLLGPRPYAIRAVYRGEIVDLFQTTDRVTLRKAARALLRALERVEAERDARQYFLPAA